MDPNYSNDVGENEEKKYFFKKLQNNENII